jgi:alpha-tubulin suppressor-like RCC1 family protein
MMKRSALLLARLLAACESQVIDPAMEEGGFISVAAGAEHTCALASGGPVHCWGANQRAPFGNLLRINQGEPVVIVRGIRFAHVSAGWFHTCAPDTAELATGGMRVVRAH